MFITSEVFEEKKNGLKWGACEKKNVFAWNILIFLFFLWILNVTKPYPKKNTLFNEDVKSIKKVCNILDNMKCELS